MRNARARHNSPNNGQSTSSTSRPATLGGRRCNELKPRRLDYLNEALALERQGDYEAALTSYRLALRDHPNDHRVLQNIAIAFTKTHRYDEAIRIYRRALEVDGTLA